MEVWGRGGVGIWRCGDVEVWRCVGVEVWERGGVGMWRYGDVEVMWRCGDVEVWGRGGGEKRYTYTCSHNSFLVWYTYDNTSVHFGKSGEHHSCPF